ncbi:transposase, partial [Thiolapillus sp.]|uniref:transposase n=3 Tax=Thiolapillus sp. TaxID=2017437 RepID=UPI0025FF73D8
MDDIRHLQSDEALGSVLNLNRLPKATTLGDWLRRMGRQPQMRDAWVKVNQSLLQSALHCCKKVTLDIDATEIVAHKADAQWTYKKNRGFMPMVGHIAETGQVVAVDFRDGNVPPAQNNLAFIQQCRQSLPEGCCLSALRIDAAGYQTKIIEYCDKEGIAYAIRAKLSATMRAQIEAISETDWQPLYDKQGKRVCGQDTYRTSHCIGDYEKAFTLIIQRKAIQGQASLDLESEDCLDEINQGGYV